MVRTFICAAVLLAAEIAQSAPPAALPPTIYSTAFRDARFRFLSLAEARAIVLEQGNLIWTPPGWGLDSRIAAPPAAPYCLSPTAVLARHKPGILVITHVQNRAELERNVNQMLLNVENAYWNLYGSYWQLYSREQGLRCAYETWKIVGAKYKAGQASRADFAQAEGQYNLFRSQRLQALDTVLDNERQLAAIAGLPIQERTRLVPSDAPTMAPMLPDWEKGLRAALRRPELRLAREGVKLTRNVWLPLAHSFGRMDSGSDILSASFRPDDSACLHLAELQVTRANQVLQDQQMKADRLLGLYYRRMSSAQAQIKAASAQREAFATQLRVRSDAYVTGREGGSLDLLLESQRFWADALATECQAIVTYNNAIAGWTYAKGTILAHAHVKLAEEAPAGVAKVRAVDREHKRTRAHVRREPGVLANTPMSVPSAASLPALWKCFPPLRDSEELPGVASKAAADTNVRLVEWTVSDIFAHGRKHAKTTP